MALAFPVVSFEPFLSGTEEEQRKTAQLLYDAFHTYGWVYLKDIGISQDEVDKMWTMSKEYFDQPLSKKLKDTIANAAVNQGYTPDNQETRPGLTSHKESYEHRRFQNEQCPSDDDLPGFKSFMDSFYSKLHDLAISVLRALAQILDLPRNYFDPMLANSNHQLRILHYMPLPSEILLQKGHSRMYPHTDFGFCTILFQDSVGGLEVDRFHDGRFVPATPVPGTCVINVADLLQRLSNDRLRSTRHQVVEPKVMKVHGEMLPARYSTAFFVHPGAEVVVAPILKDGEAASKYTPVIAGEWRTGITAKNYGLAVAASS